MIRKLVLQDPCHPKRTQKHNIFTHNSASQACLQMHWCRMIQHQWQLKLWLVLN